ncbi:LPS assembly lipoprotein LptE [Prosthecomicrobium sp. N25]|uniref:LPS assembly lipoprotein LptE n=1 Tax=Prosthecomicrobium sp. N25 TaxID=3129254 RepID=UPI00307849C4
MWWPDRTVRPRRLAGPAALLAAALALGACSDIRPLYGTTAAGDTTVARLASIDLKLVDSRVSQRVRNELVFAFYGGGEPAKPAYRLDLRVTDSSIPVGIERTESTPAAYLVQLNASFTLVDLASGTTILTGNSFANASYDFSQQRFANVRAQRDAENRAATQIAADIRTKIAAWLATHS